MVKKKTSSKTEKEVIKLEQNGNIQDIRNKLNDKFKAPVAPIVQERPVTVIPSGILSLDLAVGNAGFITGRIMDIYGWEGTGKTLLCMAIAGYIQRCKKIDKTGNEVNRIAAMLDAEGTFTKAFAESAGMDTDNLILIQSTPDKIMSGEDFFDAMVMLIGMGVDYIILDSCPALTPTTILTNEVGQGQKATRAQLMSMGLDKITPLVNANGQTLVHFINQMRGKPMDMYKQEQETGGNALKFYSSYRFQVVRSEPIEKEVLGADGIYRKKRVGVTSCVRMIKNKTSPLPGFIPSTTYHFEFDVYFESFQDKLGITYYRGVDVVKDFAEVGIRTGVVVQNSSWFSYGEVKGNGREQLYQAIRENPQVMSEIRDEVFAKMGAIPVSASESMLTNGDDA